MDAKPYLKDYIARADKVLDKFFDTKKIEVADIGRGGRGMLMAVNMLERYKKFSHGGKKLRGALIQLGYEVAGGKKEEVLQASTCIEIIHSFLLMHDDIIDKDSLRRGKPTVHKQYEADKKDSHYGISMGMNLGDLGENLGMEVLLNSRIPDERKIKAATYLARLLQRVSFGQGLDVTYEQMKNITEADVMQVHLHKTSIYTIGGPLKVGALLGGLSEKKVKAIEEYGRPVGIAFQIRDDELGLFSDEKTLGKPVGGDVKEGKNTVLHIKAVEWAKGDDKKFLNWAYGNPDITEADVERVRKITTENGALEYSQNMARRLVEEGKKFVPRITNDPDFQDTLRKMADFMIERES